VCTSKLKLRCLCFSELNWLMLADWSVDWSVICCVFNYCLLYFIVNTSIGHLVDIVTLFGGYHQGYQPVKYFFSITLIRFL